MTLPTSERRLTRSQTRAASRPIFSRAKDGTPVAATGTPSSSNTDVFSKAGRRVLAELACNDSPVVGLLPAGTPSSAKQVKSSIAGPKIRRALLANAVSELSTSTPTGENLLRSQVQLLLQKVDSDTSTTHRAPSLRALCHLNGFLASPTMLAAPTPMNTPVCTAVAASVPPPAMPPAAEDSHMPVVISSTPANFQPFDAADLSDVKSEIADQQGSEVTALQSTNQGLQMGKGSVTGPPNVPSTSEITITESVTSGRNQQVLQLTPLVLEGIDAATSTDIFLGKRVLQFNTPDKAPSAKDLSMVTFGDTCPPSSVRELEDDEVSEWSVHVNVGSPEGKGSLLLETEELTAEEEGASAAETEISTGLHEHVQKMQEECSIKVDLLWDRRTRQATPYMKSSPEEEEEEEEDFYSGKEEEDEEYGDCEKLCKEFRGMKFLEEEEERRGLPRGEGQHIRFLYADNDEILEAMVVTGEAMSGATHLKGLPAPRGRHWRFVEEE